MENMHTCCFIGHRTIEETEELIRRLFCTVEMLITRHGVDTFLFGSNSRFNSLCYELVTRCKEKYPYIKRIYVRAEFPVISDDYKSYLLTHYEDTDYPPKIVGAGRAVYVERNYEMINRSRFCVVYCKESATPKSGTKMALDYAIKQKKSIIRFPEV